jgi:hypothetical protein
MKKLAYIKSIIRSKNKTSHKRGSETAETILVTAVMLVLIVTIFYPQMQTLFTTAMTKMGTWLDQILTLV